jgi:hypothetical protein
MSLGVIVLAGSWLLILTLLVLDLVGILRRGVGFRWQATGLLMMNSAIDISAFAHLHGRSGSQIGAVQLITVPVMVAGFTIFGIGLVIQVRERRAGYPPSAS